MQHLVHFYLSDCTARLVGLDGVAAHREVAKLVTLALGHLGLLGSGETAADGTGPVK